MSATAVSCKVGITTKVHFPLGETLCASYEGKLLLAVPVTAMLPPQHGAWCNMA